MDAVVAGLSRAPLRPAAVVLALALATIAGALAFQAAGYAPCELCLKERLPFYAGIALAVVTLALAWVGSPTLARVGLALLAPLFLFSAAFGLYHAGVEWKWWPGPTGCTGAMTRPASNADFLQQLQSVHVVRCDAVAIRILGLSLAGWNAIVSLVIAFVAAAGARH